MRRTPAARSAHGSRRRACARTPARTMRRRRPITPATAQSNTSAAGSGIATNPAATARTHAAPHCSSSLPPTRQGVEQDRTEAMRGPSPPALPTSTRLGAAISPISAIRQTACRRAAMRTRNALAIMTPSLRWAKSNTHQDNRRPSDRTDACTPKCNCEREISADTDHVKRRRRTMAANKAGSLEQARTLSGRVPAREARGPCVQCAACFDPGKAGRIGGDEGARPPSARRHA